MRATQGVDKRNPDLKVNWHVTMRPGKCKALDLAANWHATSTWSSRSRPASGPRSHRQPRGVLGQAAVTHLGVAELLLDYAERVLVRGEVLASSSGFIPICVPSPCKPRTLPRIETPTHVLPE